MGVETGGCPHTAIREDSLWCKSSSQQKTLEGSHVMVAAGRTPNTEGLGLDFAGVELTDRGYVKVNERLQTTAPSVWTIGEVGGSPQFTHISVDDFRVVRDNLAGHNHVTTGRQVPFCLFTDPELARVGLSEKARKRKVLPIDCSKSQWKRFCVRAPFLKHEDF